MNQPTRWHEWGAEAFALAKAEDKPILLDIGAVWCHWCHVMDRESYESPEVSAILNEHFIPVKVDRDERPDVDARYQAAVAAISGQGGWPLTVFLTPEGKPFFGGTYFPPEDAYGRPSFQRILLAISQAFRERRGEVESESDGLMHSLAHSEGMQGHSGEFSPKIVEQMVQAALGAFDRENGGFSTAPKFPHPPVIDLLLDWYARTGEEQVVNALTTRTRRTQHDLLQPAHFLRTERQRPLGAHLHAGPAVLVVAGRDHGHAGRIQIELGEIGHGRDRQADVQNLATGGD